MAAGVLASAAVGGWLTAMATAWGLPRDESWLVIAIAAVVSGSLTAVVAHRQVGRALAPVAVVTEALRRSALRPRDHVAAYRSSLHLESSVGAREFRDLIHALHQLLMRIEQRHAQQTAWIGAVVHDLKTPIAAGANALSGIATSAGAADGPEAVMAAELATEFRGLVTELQRMLDAIRFEREDVAVRREVVDLAVIVAAVLARVPVRDGVSIVGAGLGTAIGDRTLIERAVENLVANAARYARTQVQVDVFPGLIRVSDDGEGLPASLEQLVEPFRSEPLEVAGVPIAGGAGGIGLFVARRVFELHGGRLVVESTGSRGTTLLGYLGGARTDAS